MPAKAGQIVIDITAGTQKFVVDMEILKTLTEQITDNDATHGELLGTVIKMLRAVEKKLPE